jgi:hypothetical protein
MAQTAIFFRLDPWGGGWGWGGGVYVDMVSLPREDSSLYPLFSLVHVQEKEIKIFPEHDLTIDILVAE